MNQLDQHFQKIIKKWVSIKKQGRSYAQINQIYLLFQIYLNDKVSIECFPFYKRYKNTIAYAAKLLNFNHIDFVYIKLFRCYPFYDTNVDVLLPKELWKDAFRILKERGWRLPNTLKRMQQNIVEKGKIKLYPPNKRYVPLHFYETGSWRGFEYIPISVIYDNSRTIESDGVKIRIPNDEMDFLINCAHAIFENYRLTLGELYHLGKLKENISIPDDIPRQNGWTKAFKLVNEVVERFWNLNSDQELTIKLPLFLPMERLIECWIERFNFKCKKGSVVSGYSEFITHFFWSNLIRNYKKLCY